MAKNGGIFKGFIIGLAQRSVALGRMNRIAKNLLQQLLEAVLVTACESAGVGAALNILFQIKIRFFVSSEHSSNESAAIGFIRCCTT